MSQTVNERIAEMNVAFGNPPGNPKDINFICLLTHCMNIQDEYNELMTAFIEGSVDDIRDALCDIQVFASGAQHMLGVNADADMNAVIDGVMTRFIKDEADKVATVALHAARGVTQVYFEGEYPKKIIKSLVDQPDAPKGKFLKSASYTNTVFPTI